MTWQRYNIPFKSFEDVKHCRLVCPTGAIGVTKRIGKKNNK